MNIGLEFHDSVVRAVGESRPIIRVSFERAYLHHSVGRPGVDAGAGYIQSAELIFRDAAAVGLSPACVGAISDGGITVNGDAYSLLPVPFQAKGVIEAQFVFCTGATLKITATTVSCTVHGTPQFVENFDA